MPSTRPDPTRRSFEDGVTIIELMIVITIISLITVIAIPIYQQYAARSKVSEGMYLTAPVLIKVAEYYQTNNNWPSSNSAAGVPDGTEYETDFVETILVTDVPAVTITFKTSGIPELTPATNTLVYSPTADPASNTITWECDGGTLPPWARPPRCR